MYRFFVAVVVVVTFLIGAVLIKSKFHAPPAVTQQVKVVVSFYPLQFLVTAIGGEAVEVYSIVPNGVEPHDYEPSVDDLRTVANADVLFVLGNGFEPWAEKVQTKTSVALAKDLIQNGDPHVWLDPIYMEQMAQAIYQQLAAIDPGRAETYRSRMQGVVQDLNTLDTQLRDGLRSCQRREVITTHAAFNYFAQRYALRPVEISGLSPEQEPSPARLAEVAKIVKETRATTIYFESLTSPKYAETIARETGAKTAELNPIEGLTADEQSAGENYLRVMQKNLTHLRAGLSCQ